jgi:F-type H+-transporting ATPase subunit b
MDIQIPQIIFQIINFSILFIVLSKFIYRPVLKMLDNRAEKIREGLEAADKNLKIQSKMEKQQSEVLAKAKKQADSIIKQAEAEADKIIRQAKSQAKDEAKKILETEKTSLQAQMDREVKSLKQQLASSVASATRTLLRSALNRDLQAEIIDAQIKKIEPQLFT